MKNPDARCQSRPAREAMPAKLFQKVPSIFWHVEHSQEEFLADFFYTWTTNDLESATFGFYVGLVGTLLRMQCSQILTKNRQRNRTLCHELALGSCTGMWGLSLLALSHFKVYECGVPKFQTPRRKGVHHRSIVCTVSVE